MAEGHMHVQRDIWSREFTTSDAEMEGDCKLKRINNFEESGDACKCNRLISSGLGEVLR